MYGKLAAFVTAYVLIVLTSAGAFCASAQAVTDRAIIARDISPSGQYGSVPAPPGALTQARMYDALTPLFNRVTQRDVIRDFKPEPINAASAPRPIRIESVPRSGVTITRDAYNVPYIHGATRDDVTWGAGWVTAQDRALLLQQARYDSVVAALDVPGLDAFGLITSLQSFTPSPQAERELSRQTALLRNAGAKGRKVLHDIDVYVSGINAYFRSMGSSTKPFTRNDIYAFDALKDQFVGEGGGDEARRAQFLASLQKKLGRQRGFAVYHDLRESNDPEAPSTLPGRTRLLPPPLSSSGNVIPDVGSYTSETLAPAAAAQQSPSASNVLMVSGARSATHHPIMVAGPQIGYAYPGLTLEMNLDGPGVHTRGSTSAPFPGYIFIGRNQDSAWSLTSAGLDQIDTYVETLCGHGRHRYLFRGSCRAMSFFDAGTLNGRRISYYRTVHGPVIGYARVHGRLVALSRKRASYGRDALDLLFYRDLTDGKVDNVRQFYKSANQTPQTFNSFYMDSRHIAVFTSGLIPIRPRNVDPALPIDGRGREEWRGYASLADHPHGSDPASGEIINWNNRIQAGYQAPDDNWSLGAVHRVDLLLRDLGRGRHLTPARIVGAMNEAATQDVREVTFGATLSKLLRTGRAPNRRDATMLRLLDAWREHGSNRLDRTASGKITDPGAAIIDTAWPLLADAWAYSVLQPSLRDQLATIQPRFDEPFSGPLQPNGRDQTKGWYIYMEKDLRTILGSRVRGKFAVRYCGRGNLRRCRALLWSALDRAGERLAASQGPNPSAWRESATRERISFVPGVLTAPGTSSPFTIAYTNRPSGIQQILSFSGQAPQDQGRKGPPPRSGRG